MLSPHENTTKNNLANVLGEVLSLNAYSHTLQDTSVGVLPDDPQWLTGVRDELKKLRSAANNWLLNMPECWSRVLLQFINYGTSVQAVAAKASSAVLTKDQWIKMLRDVLKSEITKAAEATTKAEFEIASQYAQFQAVQPLLDKSIQEGWDALADEEQEMVRIAEELTSLQDQISSLESKVTASALLGGKSVISSSVSIIYNLVSTKEADISYLSLVTMAFTIGKMYYDVISNTEKIADDLKKIAELQLKASQEAQALAGTKMILQLLYHMKFKFAVIQDVLPEIIQMWYAEAAKLDAVIEAIEAGAEPATYFELQTLDTAGKVWGDLMIYAQKIVNLEVKMGKPVILNPQKGKVTTIE
ncbi:hypothetical protein CSA56_05390 [candidate division KSB3 bacterium]|uniref:Uncharacterized protein n=1 Tax=candidate division KSB3 bacterium TaxID=2044937 RepID=A0A2G6KHM0_9BACT|nr:MAG: hypothetical protein CSA56_05390 [candidate division KSB3 bacterium]